MNGHRSRHRLTASDSLRAIGSGTCIRFKAIVRVFISHGSISMARYFLTRTRVVVLFLFEKSISNESNDLSNEIRGGLLVGSAREGSLAGRNSLQRGYSLRGDVWEQREFRVLTESRPARCRCRARFDISQFVDRSKARGRRRGHVGCGVARRGAARRIARARIRSSRCISRRAERSNAFRRNGSAKPRMPSRRDIVTPLRHVRAMALPGRGRARLSRQQNRPRPHSDSAKNAPPARSLPQQGSRCNHGRCTPRDVAGATSPRIERAGLASFQVHPRYATDEPD